MDRIIYGKNPLENIVNISVKNDTVFLFTEKNGQVSLNAVPYKHWALAPMAYPNYTRLKGHQYYKYIKEYKASEFEAIRKNSYKLNIWSLRNYPEAFMIRHGYTYFKNTKVAEVSALSFDIETTGLNPDADDARVLLITNSWRKNGQVVKRTFNVEHYEHQTDMINDWCMWVQDIDPSMLVGHNVVIFDIPYINKQMEKAGLALHLGRHGEPVVIEDYVRKLRVGSGQDYDYKRVEIFGREIVDTFFLAIKADIAKKYISYGLKNIIKQEGLEKQGRQHYDASSIARQWNIPEERTKIIQYAEDDSDDALKLYDIMIAPFFYLTTHIPKSFQSMIESASGSQVNALMVRSYLQDGYSVAKGEEVASFSGAVSMGIPGIYNDVLKVDVASLYPSIMRQYKIYPKNKDFNGNFLKALEYFTLERLKNKKLAKDTNDRHYKDLEQSQKVFINSAYGFMGTSGLNYNYEEGAAKVTCYGRDIVTRAIIWATGYTINKTVKKIVNKGKPNEETEYEWTLADKVAEGRGYTLVNADTDSISFTTGTTPNKEEQAAIVKDLNSLFPEMIRWEHDGYFKKVIVLKAKNYIMFDGTKIKLKGSSMKDQKKEPALKEMLDKMIHCLVYEHSNDAVNVYNEYIKEALNVKNISRWAAKKTISKAILDAAINPEARENERKPYEAIKDIPVQEGDKVFLYPAILDTKIETKQYKNGNVKEKIIKSTGLKRVDTWCNDHDRDKLIERIYDTASILEPVLDMNVFKNYTLKKNMLDLQKFLC